MKFTFGLVPPKRNDPGTAKVARPAASVFFEVDRPSPTTNRAKVTQMSNGCLHVEKSTEEKDSSHVRRNESGQYVISCSNRLDDIPKERNTSLVNAKPKEIKYGLNVLSSDAPNDAVAASSAGEVAADAGSTDTNRKPTSYSGGSSIENTKESENQDKSELIPGNAPGISQMETDKEKFRGSLDSITDGNVAQMILHDIEKQKLREMLFGTDLVERASTTVPILMRSKSNKRQRNEEPVPAVPNNDASSYEKVPVEDFGLAMLLGMGFDPKTNNNKPKEYKRRVYERAGLGADAHMKQNMDALTNASVMAKLKKDQMYHQVHSEGGNRLDAATWLLPGLYVRVVESGNKHFGEKGIVKTVNGTSATLDIGGAEVTVSSKVVETVVSLNAVKCKVVRRIANHPEKFYVPIGTVVDLAKVTKTYAKIIFRDQHITVSLDDICEFS